MTKLKFEYRISLAYLLIGSTWILLSDKVIALGPNASAESISLMQTIKGWFYVITTSLILLFFVRKHLGRLRTAEAELEKHKNHLTEMVQDKTRELDAAIIQLQSTNQLLNSRNELIDQQNRDLSKAFNELRSTQAQLAQTDRMMAVGILTTGIAHELNTPLRAIESGAILIEQKLAEESIIKTDITDQLETITQQTKRIATIVSGMSQLSGSSHSSFEKCRMHEIIDNCLAILNYHITGRINIETDYCGDELLVLGNPGQLHQALISILINAVQAIDKEGTISIQTAVKDEDICICISDTGCGIDESNLAHVMDPFYTTKEPGKGTGLGLSISFTILKNHQGNLKIESNLNKGTTVIITLPLLIQE